jgi:small subunit ribosomal protein S20
LPNHKSCEKRMKQSENNRMRNRAYRSQLRAAVKEVRTEKNKEEALKKLKEAARVLDTAATYGIIHKKNAARNKSRLTALVNKLA